MHYSVHVTVSHAVAVLKQDAERDEERRGMGGVAATFNVEGKRESEMAHWKLEIQRLLAGGTSK